MENYWNYMQSYFIVYSVILVLAIIGFCYAGKYIAEQKGRSSTEGILFGLLGILGLVILALLPSKDKSDLPEKTSITKVLGVLILIAFGLILRKVVHESYFVSDEEKYKREKSYQTSMLENTEITLPCVGCGNGTPKIYLRSNGGGFFQLMEGGVPSCRSDMRWHYNHVSEKLTVSGIYNSNCTLKQFNKVYDKRKK